MSKKSPSVRLDSTAVSRGLLAGFLAWLFPGAGHFFVGARLRAGIFCGLIALALALGALNDGNLPVVDSRAPVLSRLQVASSLALGPIDPALRLLFYGRVVYRGDDGGTLQAGVNQESLQRRRERMFRTWSAYGSAYLVAAGLMNLLLVLDAWDIAIGRKE